jgi:hypothetical protein
MSEKTDTAKISTKQRTNLEAHFAMWRFHLWSNNLGSYNAIERKLKQGKLTPFVCPIIDCGCNWQVGTHESTTN